MALFKILFFTAWTINVNIEASNWSVGALINFISIWSLISSLLRLYLFIFFVYQASIVEIFIVWWEFLATH